MTNTDGGIAYTIPAAGYFERRGLRRYAGVWSLWALGVGAVISGHFSGWNLGLSVGGWGGMLVATVIIAIMYLSLSFCIAEMSPALPHTGAAYSFARTAFGPWGGLLTGLAENVEYVLAPAVIVFFVGSYLKGIFETPDALQPLWWVVGYGLFLGLNVFGVKLSFRVTMVVTLMALLCLVVFYVAAFQHMDFGRWALNIGSDGRALPYGHGPFLPFGLGGAVAALPFAVWLFLAIEQLPLAAEECVDPKADMPKALIAAMATLSASALLVLWLNPSVMGVGSYMLGQSGEPLLDGFRAIFGGDVAKALALVAVVGLIASFHAIVFAQGRQIFSLSRAGYFPTFLSLTHPRHKTPHVAMFSGAGIGFVVMMVLWFSLGAQSGGAIIGGTLLNMVVFGAMLSYVAQAASFIVLRRKFPQIVRPYRSPFGVPGAVIVIVIALVTLFFQLREPTYRQGIMGVAIWFAVFVVYFAVWGRKRLVLSPEEEFARAHTSKV